MGNQNTVNTEAEITLGLLKAVQGDEKLTQRSASSELGIALGLVNTYLKRCVKKGLIKIKAVPRNRYSYFLTPKGFAEKSRLTAEFLSQSLSLFRQSQVQYRDLFEVCVDRRWSRIALYGEGDLSEIAFLCGQEFGVELAAVINIGKEASPESRPPGVTSLTAAGKIDAVILTDLNDPQGSYDALVKEWPEDRILVPNFLEISRTRPALME
ncbi:MAG: winged helix-turn-helix transcriptional regulator [Rhodospirillaceae bacterium]|nr:winged helix-turn-helix transcriptional regulator [Rhodospirillales bacterium]MBT3906178.1 winged helix-turn-helix transcriptional regulator [Rhodospirillaceae bacterium]MBT4700742.1 winged helix-turn-helix transcriptional regulator [Rhodospirillaceae bacterium]MBT6220391.1 winged helix-turn-helix transcriptional regulator [Rhodospirillaceae bacterium]MBT6361362.1 winged helix-turn-helix transcriptional regulator [Rhodospirillaceae bacterium]